MTILTYRFSTGDSNEGFIGFCFDVRVPGEERNETNDATALTKAQGVLEEYINGLDVDIEDLEHCVVYFNPYHLTVENIEDVTVGEEKEED